MAKILFITDLHIKAECGVRTGNYLDDIISKLEWVVSYSNKNKCIPVFGGDIFDASTVSDTVKNRVIQTFCGFETVPYVIWGNHDMRYNNHNLDEQTSLYNLIVSGVLRVLDKVEIDGCMLNGGIGGIETYGMRQIAVRHAFLNIPDGVWSISFNEMETLDECLLLLGHDHSEHDDVEYGNVKVIRPGSFGRVKRGDENKRNPQIVVIDTKDLSYEKIRIETARDHTMIFKVDSTTVAKENKTEVVGYDELIKRISCMKSETITFEECLEKAGDEEVVSFVKSLL